MTQTTRTEATKSPSGAALREWRCPKGPDHRWTGPASPRRPPCPFCANRKVSVTNSLRTQFPEIAAEWHPTRNGSLGPEDVVSGSGRLVVWKCAAAHDHVWQTRIVERTQVGRGCPFCAGQRASSSRSFQLKHPELAREWHPTKNGRLTPRDVLPTSPRKVWWKCSARGHLFLSSPGQRHRSAICPKCRPHRLSKDHCLAAANPAVAKQWHPTKNGTLTPEDVTPSANRWVWWKCPRGADHEWRATVSNRSRSSRCPFCIGKRTSKAASLARLYPALRKEWHPTKNGALRPEDVVVGSGRQVWWQCPKSTSHVYRTRVLKRVRDGKVVPCPFCSGWRVSPSGDNSFARKNPRASRLWHPTKNGSLLPTQVLPGSERKVWWKCPRGPDHEWVLGVFLINTHGSCPFCSNRKASVTNSLASRAPRVARYFDRAKNGDLSPRDVVCVTQRIVFWKCPEGRDHRWRRSVAQAVKLGKCPFCAGLELSETNALSSTFPRVASEWHPTRNARKSSEVLATAKQLAWWRCARRHEYRMSVQARTGLGRGCPVCASGA